MQFEIFGFLKGLLLTKCKDILFNYFKFIFYSNPSILVGVSWRGTVHGFTDAYQYGLTEKEAAWVGKIYCGHRCMPTTRMEDMEKEGLRQLLRSSIL